MKRIFYLILKGYVKLGLHLFFKKIIIRGSENIPQDGPLLFLANHQNALLDALLIATNNNRKTFFVARADVFKNELVKRFLAGLYMMPIYRMRDGRESLKLNDEIFEKCIEVLKGNNCLVVFPEGNHSLKRRLRPLSKGFTRIAFGALEKHPDLDLKIVPTGLNYTSHQFYRSSASIYFGEPITVRDYINSDENRNISSLKTQVADQLKKLTVHIEDEDKYEEITNGLDSNNADYLDPFVTNELIQNIDINEYPVSKESSNSILRGILLLPIRLNNLLPVLIWHSIKKGIKDPVMIGTIKFAVGITIFPLFYLIQSVVVGAFLHWWDAILYLTFSILTLPLIAKK